METITVASGTRQVVIELNLAAYTAEITGFTDAGRPEEATPLKFEWRDWTVEWLVGADEPTISNIAHPSQP